MIRHRCERLIAVVGIGALLSQSSLAEACAVCFGDPESGMAKGVVAGVWVLVGVVSAVLTGIAGVSLFWVQRSRRVGVLRTPSAAKD